LFASFVPSLCLFGSDADAEWQMAKCKTVKPVLTFLLEVDVIFLEGTYTYIDVELYSYFFLTCKVHTRVF
jgi:hypothetical protein